jgi:hypothetical protein
MPDERVTPKSHMPLVRFALCVVPFTTADALAIGNARFWK